MKATFENLLTLVNNESAARRKLMQKLSRKTEAEQKQIFELSTKIAQIQIPHEQYESARDLFKKFSKGEAMYYQLLLAIQLHEANQGKSQYLAEVREARQDVQSLKTAPLAKVIELLMPLVEELRKCGASWETIAKTLTKKQRRILSSRTVTTDYLKKTYSRYKKKNV
jgi:hypothetical protein